MNWLKSLLTIVGQLVGYLPPPPKEPTPEKTLTPSDLQWVDPPKPNASTTPSNDSTAAPAKDKSP